MSILLIVLFTSYLNDAVGRSVLRSYLTTRRTVGLPQTLPSTTPFFAVDDWDFMINWDGMGNGTKKR